MSAQMETSFSVYARDRHRGEEAWLRRFHASTIMKVTSASLTSSPSTRQILAALVDRWCAACGVEGRVDKLLDRVRRETREMFWKVFGDAAPKAAN